MSLSGDSSIHHFVQMTDYSFYIKLNDVPSNINPCHSAAPIRSKIKGFCPYSLESQSILNHGQLRNMLAFARYKLRSTIALIVSQKRNQQILSTYSWSQRRCNLVTFRIHFSLCQFQFRSSFMPIVRTRGRLNDN